jgi:hypothetical protein
MLFYFKTIVPTVYTPVEDGTYYGMALAEHLQGSVLIRFQSFSLRT